MRHGTTDQGRRRCNRRRRTGRSGSRSCSAGTTGAGSFAGTSIFGFSARRPDRFRILDPQRWQIQLLLFVCAKRKNEHVGPSHTTTHIGRARGRDAALGSISRKGQGEARPVCWKAANNRFNISQPLHWPAPFFYSARLPEHIQPSKEYCNFLIGPTNKVRALENVNVLISSKRTARRLALRRLMIRLLLAPCGCDWIRVQGRRACSIS